MGDGRGRGGDEGEERQKMQCKGLLGDWLARVWLARGKPQCKAADGLCKRGKVERWEP